MFHGYLFLLFSAYTDINTSKRYISKVFDEIPHSEKVLKRHQNSDDPCIMAWDHYISIEMKNAQSLYKLNRRNVVGMLTVDVQNT
jgi:hypothetical protein